MRILHTSDWHLGCTLENRSRLPEQEKFIAELVQIVKDEKIDLVLIAGDIFDTANPPAAAEELYYNAIDALSADGKRAVVIIAGNHDNPERLCAASPLAGRQGIILLGLPKEKPWEGVNNVQGKAVPIQSGQGWVELGLPGVKESVVIGLLPYPSEARLNEVLLGSLEDEEIVQQSYAERVSYLFQRLNAHFKPQTVNIAVSHLFVRGGITSDSERPIQLQLGGAMVVEPASLPSKAQYIALGHLHRPQNVHNAPVLARYSGSPIAYSFSESGYAKSVTIVDVKPGEKAAVQEIYLSSGYPLVKWQAKEGLAQVYNWINGKRDLDAWIDLEIHLSKPLSAKEIGDLRRMRERFIHIRPVFPQTQMETIEGRAHLPLDELFCSFFRRQNSGAEPDEALVKLFLELVGSADNNISSKEEESL
ncbi:exonuclease SbcCD subunit D [Bacillota bacterium LX-D]|nr:exonuclease SbcCD subunit D [Bacillota bacterium LX-D]